MDGDTPFVVNRIREGFTATYLITEIYQLLTRATRRTILKLGQPPLETVQLLPLGRWSFWLGLVGRSRSFNLKIHTCGSPVDGTFRASRDAVMEGATVNKDIRKFVGHSLSLKLIGTFWDNWHHRWHQHHIPLVVWQCWWCFVLPTTNISIILIIAYHQTTSWSFFVGVILLIPYHKIS